jgi:hypothetical protein
VIKAFMFGLGMIGMKPIGARSDILGERRRYPGHAARRSFIASCQRLSVEPFSWFKDVLARIPNHPINRITELLPHNWASAQA